MNKELQINIRYEPPKFVVFKLKVLVESTGIHDISKKETISLEKRKNLKAEFGEWKDFSVMITRLKEMEKAVEVVSSLLILQIRVSKYHICVTKQVGLTVHYFQN